jgi:hypothetical protein
VFFFPFWVSKFLLAVRHAESLAGMPFASHDVTWHKEKYRNALSICAVVLQFFDRAFLLFCHESGGI